MKDEEIVIKYCDDVLTSNDKAQQDWMKSKKELEDKYPEIWNNPQVKKVFENIKYIIKNIIETVRTEAIEYRKVCINYTTYLRNIQDKINCTCFSISVIARP